MREVIDDNNNDNNNINNKRAIEGTGCTIATASTPILTEPSTTLDRVTSSTMIKKKPSLIVTNVNNDNCMAVSPLIDRTNNTARFGFSSKNNNSKYIFLF